MIGMQKREMDNPTFVSIDKELSSHRQKTIQEIKKDCQQEECPLHPFMPYKTPSGNAISTPARKKQEADGIIIPPICQSAQAGGMA